jgi:hypothetical protein
MAQKKKKKNRVTGLGESKAMFLVSLSDKKVGACRIHANFLQRARVDLHVLLNFG